MSIHNRLSFGVKRVGVTCNLYKHKQVLKQNQCNSCQLALLGSMLVTSGCQTIFFRPKLLKMLSLLELIAYFWGCYNSVIPYHFPLL